MRIMVVEDEELLRDGLIKMIGRMSLNGSVVAIAGNGEDALEQLSHVGVDLIITDIRMPRMDGLQLLEEVQRLNLDIRSIILSGYDDFEYAKRALKLNCKDYLLKPVMFQDLYELLSKIEAEFIAMQTKMIEEVKLKGILNQNQSLIRHEFLRTFIQLEKMLQIEARLAEAETIGVYLQASCYSIIAVQIEEKPEKKRNYGKNGWMLMKYALHNIVEELTSYMPCYYDEHEVLIVLHAGIADEEELNVLGNRIAMKSRELLKITVSIGISEKHDLYHLSLGYGQATRVLKYRLISDQPIIEFHSQVSRYTNHLIKPHMDQLAELFDLDHADTAIKQLKEWYEALKAAELSLGSLEVMEQEVRVVFHSLLRHFVKELGDREYDLGAEIGIMETADSFYARMNPLLNVLKAISSDSKKGFIENCTSKQVMKYIREHYNENINLTSISEFIYMNPAYLSVMFKKKAGKSIIEYLTEVRMGEAKKLLLNMELKTYEIAEMVGYNDAAYFSTLFKKYSGVSPLEYRTINIRR
ncbi:response regulator [Paenibacillus sp. OV219]|uniref:response regulator transcription factor n=1 Tax=Paenibacillus sp. OV219 TaxID=1884377 RepID=UPI0008D20372|nr:response regulator [Paenibacillus sp. OV219]SEO89061.1 two component transcriptional regulator, AraC family [Paenibacillus sp. OV219]